MRKTYLNATTFHKLYETFQIKPLLRIHRDWLELDGNSGVLIKFVIYASRITLSEGSQSFGTELLPRNQNGNDLVEIHEVKNFVRAKIHSRCNLSEKFVDGKSSFQWNLEGKLFITSTWSALLVCTRIAPNFHDFIKAMESAKLLETLHRTTVKNQYVGIFSLIFNFKILQKPENKSLRNFWLGIFFKNEK